jgi:hypothetical protein
VEERAAATLDPDVAEALVKEHYAEHYRAWIDEPVDTRFSLGERLLARTKDDPLRGQILRVVTVYVSEERRGGERALEITFAFDALGADLPSLVPYEIPAGSESSVCEFLDSVAPPPPATEPPTPDVSPVRGAAPAGHQCHPLRDQLGRDAGGAHGAAAGPEEAEVATRAGPAAPIPSTSFRVRSTSGACGASRSWSGPPEAGRCCRGSWCAVTGVARRRGGPIRSCGESSRTGRGRTWRW